MEKNAFSNLGCKRLDMYNGQRVFIVLVQFLHSFSYLLDQFSGRYGKTSHYKCIRQCHYRVLGVIQLRVIIYSSWIIPLAIKRKDSLSPENYLSFKSFLTAAQMATLPFSSLSLICSARGCSALYFRPWPVISILPNTPSFSSTAFFHHPEFWKASASIYTATWKRELWKRSWGAHGSELEPVVCIWGCRAGSTRHTDSCQPRGCIHVQCVVAPHAPGGPWL